MKQSPAPSIDLAGAAKVMYDDLTHSKKRNSITNVRNPKFWIALASTIITIVFSGGVAYNQLSSATERMDEADDRIEESEAAIVDVKSEQKISNIKLEALQETQREMAKDVKEIQSDVNKIQQDIAAIKEAVRR